MIPIEVVLTALALGLAGAGHCIGMCGGIASAIGIGSGQRRSLVFSYHLGRVTSYALIGALFGAATSMMETPIWRMSLRYFAALMLIAMGLYIAHWWRGLTWLERLGAKLWRPIQELSKPLLPATKVPQALLLGGAWGFLPCGLIYSSLAWSSAQANALQSGLLMLVFGLGTLPAMLTASFGAQWIGAFLGRLIVRQLIGLTLIGWGILNLLMLLRHANHA